MTEKKGSIMYKEVSGWKVAQKAERLAKRKSIWEEAGCSPTFHKELSGFCSLPLVKRVASALQFSI